MAWAASENYSVSCISPLHTGVTRLLFAFLLLICLIRRASAKNLEGWRRNYSSRQRLTLTDLLEELHKWRKNHVVNDVPRGCDSPGSLSYHHFHV